MKKDEEEAKIINVKFGKTVAENISKANQLVDHFNDEHKKADQARNTLIQSLMLAYSGLDSLEGYRIDVDIDKGEAILTKK